MRKIINIGVLSCANIAERSMLPAIKSSSYARLTAISSRSSEKAGEFAKKFGCSALSNYDELISRTDIDAVYIPLPPGLHEEWTLKALKSGKHVLCEKPFATNLPASENIVKEARQRNLLVMENYMFIHHPQHHFVKEVLGSGEIGEVRLFKGSFGFPPFPPDNFRYSRKLGGGALLDAGGYPIRAARFFLGDDLECIGASLFMDGSFEVDTYGAAMYKNSIGKVAQISFGFDNFYQCNYMLWGSRGVIKIKRAYTIPPHMPPEVTIEKQDLIKKITLPPANHFRLSLDFFSSEVGKPGNYEVHYSSVLHQSRLLESARTNAE